MRAERRRARKEEERAWRRRWRSVPYRQQRLVEQALRRGTAVEEPALARIAAEKASHDRAVAKRLRWLTIPYALVAVFWLGLVLALLGVIGDDAASPLRWFCEVVGDQEMRLQLFFWVPGIPLGFAVAIGHTVAHLQKLARAEAANRELASRQEIAWAMAEAAGPIRYGHAARVADRLYSAAR